MSRKRCVGCLRWFSGNVEFPVRMLCCQCAPTAPEHNREYWDRYPAEVVFPVPAGHRRAAKGRQVGPKKGLGES